MGAGARPNFGVARPMHGGGGMASDPASAAPVPGGMGGDQFPPLPPMGGSETSGQAMKADAMARLTDRANAVHETGNENGGF